MMIAQSARVSRRPITATAAAAAAQSKPSKAFFPLYSTHTHTENIQRTVCSLLLVLVCFVCFGISISISSGSSSGGGVNNATRVTAHYHRRVPLQQQQQQQQLRLWRTWMESLMCVSLSLYLFQHFVVVLFVVVLVDVVVERHQGNFVVAAYSLIGFWLSLDFVASIRLQTLIGTTDCSSTLFNTFATIWLPFLFPCHSPPIFFFFKVKNRVVILFVQYIRFV